MSFPAVFSADRLQPDWRDALLRLFFVRRWRGLFPLQQILRPDGYLRARTRYGPVFALSPLECIDSVVLREGFYEREVFDALQPFLIPGAVFWDIGANIGLHAVSAAKVGSNATVCAIEANPRPLALLWANIVRNQAAVTVWPSALGATDGDAALSLTIGNSGRSVIVSAQGVGPTISVRVRRAESLTAAGHLPVPTVIKIDVEGYEANVLAEFGHLLDHRSLRAVVFEDAADLLRHPASSPAAQRLFAAGLTLRPLERREATEHPLGNFLAVRA